MSQGLSLYQQECKIMDKFDFDKVHRVMQTLNWKWLGESPTVDQLKTCASTLLTVVQNKIHAQGTDDNAQWFSASTGGFKASIKLVNGNWRLSLEFIVASHESYEF